MVRTLNTLFNPFEYENILSPPQASPWSKALHHAGSLAVGYGGLALLARKLLQYKTEKEVEKGVDKIKPFVSASYPTLSPDPELNPEKEEEEQTPGAEETEALPELTKVAVSELWTKTLSGPRELGVKTMWGAQDPAHLALATAAAVIGGMGGWQLAEYLADKKRKQALSQRVTGAADEIDKLLYEELQKKQQKEAAGEQLTPQSFSRQHPYLPSSATPSGMGGQSPGLLSSAASVPRLLKGLESLWWLWAVSAFALTYRAAKTYGDVKDPNRRRLKQLQEVAAERAKVKNAPVMMQVSSPAPVRTRKVAPEPVQAPAMPTKPRDLEQDMGKAPEIDKDDPYAHLLTM